MRSFFEQSKTKNPKLDNFGQKLSKRNLSFTQQWANTSRMAFLASKSCKNSMTSLSLKKSVFKRKCNPSVHMRGSIIYQKNTSLCFQESVWHKNNESRVFLSLKKSGIDKRK